MGRAPPLLAHRARLNPLSCKNQYLVLALKEETAVQAVVDSIAWAFRKLKKRRCREMSARGYALHSVRSQLSFFSYNPLQGVPGNGEFKTHDQLVALFRTIIFTCSVEHAAVNFGQYDAYAFTPNYPSFLSGKPPQNKVRISGIV